MVRSRLAFWLLTTARSPKEGGSGESPGRREGFGGGLVFYFKRILLAAEQRQEDQLPQESRWKPLLSQRALSLILTSLVQSVVTAAS